MRALRRAVARVGLFTCLAFVVAPLAARASSISGTVTGPGAVPLLGVSVNVYNSSGSFVAGGSTNASGVYSVTLPAAGTYFARTFAGSGFVNQLYNGLTCASCTVTAGTPIAVGALDTPGIDFALPAAGVIAGTVRDEITTAGLAGITMTVVDAGNAFVTSTTTLPGGTYSVGGLPAGSFFVRTDNSTLGYINELYNNVPCALQFSCPLTSATPVPVVAGSTTLGIDFDLKPGGRFAGTITDAATSAPLSGVTVEVVNAAGQVLSRTNTDASGVYASRGLATGSYFLRTTNTLGYINRANDGTICLPNCTSLAALTPIGVVEGVTVSGVDFALDAGGRIAGNIKDSATLANLQNVTVNIYSSTGSTLTFGVTDASGNYSSRDGLPSGNYFVGTFNSVGYINELHSGLSCAAGCNPTFGTPVAVTTGSTTPGIDFLLDKGGRIGGQVTSTAGGAPISLTTVQVVNATGTTVSTGFTDASGLYISNAGLLAGTYFLRTSNSQGFVNEIFPDIPCVGTVCPASGGTAVSVSLGTTTTVNIDLAPGGRVSGSILDDTTSAPVTGASVSILNSAGVTLTSGTVDPLGNYITGAGLPSDSYFARSNNTVGYINELYPNVPCPTGCSLATGTPIAVTVGTTTPGINFALGLGGRVTGHVTDQVTSAPLANVTISLSIPGSTGGSATTDSNGAFVIAGLVPGTYYARTVNSQGYIDKLYNDIPCFNPCNVTSGTPIVIVGSGTVSGVDFALHTGGRISGTVTDAATTLPIAGVSVSLVAANGATVATGVTGLLGNYVTAGGVPTGVYYARTLSNAGYLGELFDNILCVGSCTIVAGVPISVVEGSTTPGISFALQAGGRVSGSVIDTASSAPLQGIQVQISDSIGRVVTTATSDAGGNFLTGNGLPTGMYFARTINSQGFIDEQYNNKPCPQSCPAIAGDSFSVTVGSTTPGINFSLDRGGRIAGVVTDEGTGQPISGVNVAIVDASGRSFTSGTTNAFGQYLTSSGLPAGTYFARTNNSLGYLNERFGGTLCIGNCLVTGGTPITVTGTATTAGIDFVLAPGGRISGQVMNLTTSAPVGNVSVLVFDGVNTTPVSSGTTNALGNYTTTAGLPAGSYFVRTANSLGLINKLWVTPTSIPCLGCNPTTGTPVAVTLGATTPNIDFGLDVGGRVSGVVTLLSTSAPIPGVLVSIYDASGTLLTRGSTDGTGTYATPDGLPSGSYFARTENSQGLVNKVFDNLSCATTCVPAAGTPVVVVAGSTTLGIDFVLEPDTDPDADGIVSTIDAAPAVFSDDFSDVPQGGTTTGTITARNGWTVNVADVSPGGVQLQLAGAGGSAATIETCPAGGPEGVLLDVAGETAVASCDPTTGSTTLRAVIASPTIELRDPPSGAGVVVLLTTGQAATIGSPVTASPSNTETIVVRFVDAAGVPFGSFNLDPGESVNAQVNADGGVTATVDTGVVTVTVRGQTVTLQQGQSQIFPSPTPGPQAQLDALVQKVKDLRASNDIKTPGVANALITELKVVKALVARGRMGDARVLTRVIIAELSVLKKVKQITAAAFNALVPPLETLAASL